MSVNKRQGMTVLNVNNIVNKECDCKREKHLRIRYGTVSLKMFNSKF